MSKLTCPYCFEKFTFSQIAFRCLNPNPTLCAPEEDRELARYERKENPKKLNRVFTPGNMILSKIKLNLLGRSGKILRCECGENTKKVCPFCHNDLPHGFGEIKMKTIALIGAKDAGKSHYIAVLIHELAGDNVGGKFNATLQALDDKTSERYKNDFETPIYKKKEFIPTTVFGYAEKSYPLIYKFSVENSNGLPFKRYTASSMVFFDTAGEDLDKIDLMTTQIKYLSNSDGIIFLLDPLQMPAVRNLLPSSVKLPKENTEPVQIIGRAIQLIRETNGIGQTAKIKTPVAVAFSKIDEIRGLFDPGSSIHKASKHNGYFDITDAEMVSESIKAHLVKWEGGKLDRLLNHNFQTYSYFGLSALGSSPQSDGSIALGAVPFRVEDPFLWILREQGIISGRRSD